MVWQWLRRFRKRRGVTSLQHLHFVMYTRPDCCLCDKAKKLIHQQQLLYGFPLEMRNIADKKDLEEQFGCNIPVIEVNGKVRFRGIVNEVLLQRFLQAEAKKVTRRARRVSEGN